MIVYTVGELKTYETRSDMPNSDWTGHAEFVIDETDENNAELIGKIKQFTPYFSYSVGSNGKLVDVEKTGELTVETPKDPLEVLQTENKTLKAKIDALTKSNQMLEDCIVEMAEIVYA